MAGADGLMVKVEVLGLVGQRFKSPVFRVIFSPFLV